MSSDCTHPPSTEPQGHRQAKTFFRDPIEEFYGGELFVGEDGMHIVVPLL